MRSFIIYSSRSIIRMMQSRRMRLAGHVARTGRSGINIGYWCESQKRSLGRPRRRWMDNIKMDLRDIGWGGMDQSGSGEGPVEGSCEHGDEPTGSLKCWEVIE
jgi:hypothetical protein